MNRILAADVPCWGTVDANGNVIPKILTTSYVDGLPVSAAPDVGTIAALVAVVLSGTAPTSIELQARYSIGGTWRPPIPVLNSVAGNIADQGAGEFSITPAGATEILFWINVLPGVEWRFDLKRTGGDGTTAAVSYVDFFEGS